MYGLHSIRSRPVWLAVGAALLAAPWFWWPWAKVPFEVPRAWLIHGAAVLGTIVTSVWLRYRHRIPSLNQRVLWPLLAIWGWSIGASLTGSDWLKSLIGNFYRADGLLTLTALIGWAILIGWWQVPEKVVTGGIAVSMVSVSLGTLISRNPALTFGNPHYLAGFLVVGLPVLISLFQTSSELKRLGWATAILVQTAALCQTGALLSIALLGLIWWWWKTRSRLWLAAAGTLVFLGMYVGWVYKPTATFDAESRGRLWRRLAQAVAQRPITGWGVANVDHALEHAVWPYVVRFDVYVDKAHSTLWETAVTTGIIGLGLYGWLTVGLLRTRMESRWLMVLLAWFIQSQLNVVSVATDLIGWTVIGIALSRWEK